MLPQVLQEQIEARASGLQPGDLRRDAAALSERYRSQSGHGARLLTSGSEAEAYALTRMPATYEAVRSALASALAAAPFRPQTLLDAGAGTGAASWAAHSLLELDGVTCLEREPAMRALGSELMQSGGPALKQAQWISADLTRDALPCRAQLVTAAYVMNEMTPGDRAAVADLLWQAAEQMLLIVEPGTPEGWRQLMETRDRLLARGARLAAPCSHEGPCRVPQGDWCSFTARVQRSRLHRMLKGGDVPYEDESYMYLAFTREAVMKDTARVLRHPAVQKGQIDLLLCAEGGNISRTVRRRDGELFKAARKAECGGTFPLKDMNGGKAL